MKRPSLRADYDGGEGAAVVPDEWLADDPLMRADILQDWISNLQAAYEIALDDFTAELEALPKPTFQSAETVAWVRRFRELNPHLAVVEEKP